MATDVATLGWDEPSCMTTQSAASISLTLPLIRDRQAKSDSIRVRLSAREKVELQRRAHRLGCTVTELLLGLFLEHGNRVAVVDR